MTGLARLSVQPDDLWPSAWLEGEIDLSNVATFSDQLGRAVPNEALGLYLDLSQVTYLDSAGVRLLFTLGREMRNRQQQLRLVVPEDSPIRRVLMLTHVTAIADIQSKRRISD
jgi:anti-anti-sigma factor